MTTILATFSTLCIVISAILIAVGWVTIRKTKDRKKHQKIMVTASGFALTFFIVYMSRTTFMGNVLFAGPDYMVLPYHIFLFIHIVLATLGGILGLVSLYLGFRGRFKIHKKISPYTSVIWFLTGITGVTVYFLLFVIWPGDTKSSLLQAIFGW